MAQKYTIIFRACDSVNAVNKNPRPFDLTKGQIIKICFLSLIDALQDVDYKIIIVGDKLSEEMINFFKPFKTEMILGSYGNDASIRESFKIASTVYDDEWVYFCEDDYLHVANSFRMIDNFLTERNEILAQEIKFYNLSSLVNLTKKDLFIHPPDYPDRYRPKYRRLSFILASKDCHWRQVNSCTFTFLTKASTVKKYISLFNTCSHKANDRRMSRKLFGRLFPFFAPALCLSPLRGLSTHMHRDTMTPLVNWEELVVRYKGKIETT